MPDPPSDDYWYWWPSSRPPIAIALNDHLTMSDGGVLQLLFDTDPWDSLISFDPGIPVTLGGTLELTFADDVDLASQLGRTLHVFDWTGVSPTGQFQVASHAVWDESQLYTRGDVTLLGPVLAGDLNFDGESRTSSIPPTVTPTSTENSIART